MSDGVKISIDTSGLQEALERLPAVQHREIEDILKYNCRKLLKQVAWLTRRADKGDVPNGKKGRIGRLRAGWFAAWQGLGMAGMAYSTPGAIQGYATEGSFGDQSKDKTSPMIYMANECPYGDDVPNFAQSVQNEVDRQTAAIHKYTDEKLGEMLAKALLS